MLYYSHSVQLTSDSDIHLRMRESLMKVSWVEMLCCFFCAALFCLTFSELQWLISALKLIIIIAKFWWCFSVLITLRMLIWALSCCFELWLDVAFSELCWSELYASSCVNAFWMLQCFQIFFCLRQLWVVAEWLSSQFSYFADMWWHWFSDLMLHVMILQTWSKSSCELMQM